MKIQIGGLSEGLHRYHFTAPAQDLSLGDGFSGEITVDAELEKAPSQAFVRARIQASGTFSCDRCTRDFVHTVTPSYRMVYVWDTDRADSMDPSEIQVVPPGLSVIDLTEDVRQTILLSVPLKLLCTESCRGLCARCGTDLNSGTCTCPNEESDSRWESLRGLMNDAN